MKYCVTQPTKAFFIRHTSGNYSFPVHNNWMSSKCLRLCWLVGIRYRSAFVSPSTCNAPEAPHNLVPIYWSAPWPIGHYSVRLSAFDCIPPMWHSQRLENVKPVRTFSLIDQRLHFQGVSYSNVYERGKQKINKLVVVMKLWIKGYYAQIGGHTPCHSGRHLIHAANSYGRKWNVPYRIMCTLDDLMNRARKNGKLFSQFTHIGPYLLLPWWSVFPHSNSKRSIRALLIIW